MSHRILWSVPIFLLVSGGFSPPTIAQVHSGNWAAILARADSLCNSQELDSAVATGRMALHMLESDGSATDTNLAYAYHRMGYYFIGVDQDSSESYFRAALRIWESEPSANPKNYARTVNNLGILVQRDGRFTESAELFNRSLNLKRSYLPPRHVDIATSLLNLSVLYIRTARYAEAERYLEEAKSIWDSAGADNSIYFINIAAVYNSQFRFEESIAASKEMMQLCRQTGHTPGYTLAAGNLAEAYLALGMVGAADSVFQEVIRATDTVFNQTLTMQEGRIAYRIDLARTKRLLGQYDLAGSILEQVDSMDLCASGVQSVERYRMLYEYGELFRQGQRLQPAVRSFEQAIALGERLYGATSPKIVPPCLGLAKTLLAMREPLSAIVHAKRAVDVSYLDLASLAISVPENDALSYAKSAEEAVACYLDALRRISDASSEEMEFGIDLILRSKALTTDLILQRRRELGSSADPGILRLREKRRFAAGLLASSLLKRNSDSLGSVQNPAIDTLRLGYQRACSELVRYDLAARADNMIWTTTASAIAQALPGDAVAFEYFALEQCDDTGKTMYAVVVIEDQGAHLFWLTDSDKLEEAVESYNAHMRRIAQQGFPPTARDLADYRRISATLYRCAIEPVARFMSGKSKLFVSTAGLLNLVSFPGLCDSDGRYLVESIEIHCVDALRGITKGRADRNPGSGTLAIGDPDFDLVREDSGALVVKANPVPQYSGFTTRGGCSAIFGAQLTPLSGTRVEIERVKNNSPAEEEFVALLGDAASETNFKREVPGKRHVHLATHGFNLRDCSGATGRTTALDNPLLTSGLFLAGARLAISQKLPRGGEDGIMYALEVAELDLSGVELVTLSACETALGVPRGSDGLYGLRRAFELAGAGTVVASLWPVSDDATAALLPGLYMTSTDSRSSLLRQAQSKYLHALRAAGRVDHPFLWAAFLAYGQ